MLIHLAGYSLFEPWLVMTYGLYALAFLCWPPVVWLQIRTTQLAEASLMTGVPLGNDYRNTLRLWFALGWPAFLGLVSVFWLMTAKPALW